MDVEAKGFTACFPGSQTTYLGWIEKQIGHEIKYCKSGKLAGGVDLLLPESLTRKTTRNMMHQLHEILVELNSLREF